MSGSTWGDDLEQDRDGMESVGRQLLSGMSNAGFEAWLPSILEVGEDGTATRHEGLLVGEFTRRLWPGQDAVARARSSTLRFLADSGPHEFMIRDSRHGYLVRANFVRALLEPRRILFIGPWTATFDAFLPEFMRMLEVANDCAFAPFALECIICTSVTMHQMRLRVMRPVIEKILLSANIHGSQTAMSRLYPLKLAIAKFVDQVRPLHRCLHSMLMNAHDYGGAQHLEPGPKGRTPVTGSFLGDQDERESEPSSMLRLRWRPGCLRRPGMPAGTGSFGSDASAADPPDDDGGFDEFLETWALNCQEILDEARFISANIEEGMRFSEASLSYLRTWLMKSELVALVVGLSLNFGATVSGIFGMNLQSGLEEVPHVFWAVTAFIFVAGAVICGISVSMFWRSKKSYSRRCAEFGENVFFSRLDDDDYVLSSYGVSEQVPGELSRRAFEQILQDLRTPTPARIVPEKSVENRPGLNRTFVFGPGRSLPHSPFLSESRLELSRMDRSKRLSVPSPRGATALLNAET